MDIKKDIIDEARTWLETPYGHLGREKGLRVDCIGVPVGVAETLELKDKAFFEAIAKKYSGYDRIPAGLSFYNALKSFLPEVPPYRAEPSDVLLLQAWGYDPSHAAILTDVNTIIHASIETKKCVEHVYDEYWRTRTIAAFRLRDL